MLKLVTFMARRKWTTEEKSTLLEYVENPNGITVKAFGEKIGRTEPAIYSKLRKMRKKDDDLPYVRNYSEEQEDYLSAFSNDPDGDSIIDVAEYFGKQYEGIGSKLVRMRKEYEHVGHLKRRWTEREDDAIKASRGKMTYKELGQALGRSESATSQRARILGVSKPSTDSNTLSELSGEIRRMAVEGYTRNEIAQRTNLEYMVIHNFLYRNNIECKNESRKKTEQQKRMHREFLSHAFGRY